MSPEQQALRDMWIREMWASCPEVSREQRAVDRESAGQRTEALGTLCARPVDDKKAS